VNEIVCNFVFKQFNTKSIEPNQIIIIYIGNENYFKEYEEWVQFYFYRWFKVVLDYLWWYLKNLNEI
jgi:hypothetical protein